MCICKLRYSLFQIWKYIVTYQMWLEKMQFWILNVGFWKLTLAHFSHLEVLAASNFKKWILLKNFDTFLDLGIFFIGTIDLWSTETERERERERLKSFQIVQRICFLKLKVAKLTFWWLKLPKHQFAKNSLLKIQICMFFKLYFAGAWKYNCFSNLKI